MLWTYSTNKAGLNSWPPAWLSSTAANKDGEPVNPVLMAGLDYFIRRATNTVQVMAADWTGVSALVAALSDYEKAEKALGSAVADGTGRVSSQLFQSLLAAKDKVDSQLKLCGKSEIFAGGVSLTNAFANFTNNVTRYAAGAFIQVETENDNALKADPTFKVFQDIRVRLKNEQNKITGSVTSIVTPELLAKLLHLDECFLAQVAGRTLYQMRGDLYASAKELANPDLFASGGRAELIEKFQRWDAARQKLAESVADYKGCLQTEVGRVAAFYRDQAAKTQAQGFLVAYQRAAEKDLAAGLGFPVLRDTSARMLSVEDLDGAQKLLAQIADELGLIAGRKLDETKSWRDFTARTLDLSRVVKVIKGSDEKPNFCAISLCKRDDDQHGEEDLWRNGLRYVRLDAQGAEMVMSNNAKEEALGTVLLRGPLALQLLKQSTTEVYKAVPSPKWTAWGPLYLIAQQGGKPQADGSWLVNLPTNDPTYKGSLRLSLKFDQPLPDLEHWPKN
jgi:hypothetical protein